MKGSIMKILLLFLILGLLVGFGTILKILAFSVLTILGLPLVILLVISLIYIAIQRN